MQTFRRAVLVPAVLVALSATAAQAQVKLQFKFPENQEYRYEDKTVIDQVLTIMGMEVPTKVEQAIATRMNTGAKRPDGSVPAMMTIDTLNLAIEAPGASLTIDSEDQGEAPKDEPPQFKVVRDVIKAIGGASYTVVVDKDGKVAAIEGAERAVPKADALEPAVAEEIRKRFDPERLKKEMVEEFGIFPDILLRQGEPWERSETMDLGSGQSMTFQRTYEYQGTAEQDGRTLDKIGMKATAVTYAMEANEQVTVPKSDLKIESSEGTILFDRERGVIVRKQDKTRITGDMTLSIGGNDLPSKLDLTLDSTSELKPPAK
jgi:hypothetical protein